MITVATHQKTGKELNAVSVLGGGKTKTARTVFDECNKRIATLTEFQKEILINGDFPSQKHVAFLAVCKFHAFIRDFTIEVIREKLLVFDDQLTEGEYFSFFRQKTELHPEMDKLTSRTQEGVRQVTFKILEQAGIIDNIKNKRIQIQILDRALIRAITCDNPDWLKIFLYSDLDIMNETNENGRLINKIRSPL